MRQYFPVLDEPLPNDMELVSQSGGIDLRYAMSSGTVPGDLEGTENNSTVSSPLARLSVVRMMFLPFIVLLPLLMRPLLLLLLRQPGHLVRRPLNR